MWTNTSHLVYIVLSPILSTCFAVLNTVTIFIFCVRFRLSTLSLIIMVNICACDIFVCAISNTFYIANLLHPVHAWSTGSVSCKLFKCFTMLMNVSQIFLLCVLNADRLRRLVNSSAKQWTKRNGVVFSAICWILAGILCFPRLALFGVNTIVRPINNGTEMLAINRCKPLDIERTGFTAMTITTFVLSYALPTMYIFYALVRTHVFIWKRRNCIHVSSMSNAVTRMNSELSRTFNLTSILFMAIWTPFFIMTLMDVHSALINDKKYVHVNFALRCTLLIVGSAKPLIYIACLDKFRKSFRCTVQQRLITSNSSSDRRSTDEPLGRTETINTITV